MYTIENLPESVATLPDEYKYLWVNSFQYAFSQVNAPVLASKIAWEMVKNRAVERANIQEFSLFITKATLSDDGKMQWAGTASDIYKDVFDESMSIDLFQGFVNDFDGNVFVSLSHYPRLNGKGEVGLVTHLYIDGNQLKAKGTFHDTTLGKQCYNSIRKDRRDNIPQEKRVRISIGFYDRKHKHGDTIWEYASGKPCVQCALGVKQKVYLAGVLEHCALTRIPANKRTQIEVQE